MVEHYTNEVDERTKTRREVLALGAALFTGGLTIIGVEFFPDKDKPALQNNQSDSAQDANQATPEISSNQNTNRAFDIFKVTSSK